MTDTDETTWTAAEYASDHDRLTGMVNAAIATNQPELAITYADERTRLIERRAQYEAEIAAWDAQREKREKGKQSVYAAIAYINGGAASVATIYTGSRVLRAIADAATRAGLSVVATDRYWNGNRAVEMHLSDDGARHTDTLYVHHYHTTDLDRFIADMAAWHQTVLTDGVAA